MTTTADAAARHERARQRLEELYRFWRSVRHGRRRVAIHPMMLGLSWSEYGDAEVGSFPVRLLNDPS